MALINVDEIFGDPDFFDDVICTRYMRYVDDDGRVVDSGSDFIISACIQPATNAQVEQLPEASRLTTASNITIYTNTPLVALSQSYAGDVVHWAGGDYRVMTVNDWTPYGAGYWQAVAQLLELNDSDPEV